MIVVRVFLLALLLFAVSATAATDVINPALERRMAGLEDGEALRVLVVLADQVDAPALARELHVAKASQAEAHRQVVGALQVKARTGQAGLLAALEADKSAGGVLGYRPHWIINAVVVTAPAATIRELALRPDVARIEPDLEVELIAPVAVEERDAAKATQSIGLAPGVAAINAPRVWEEFGIDGSGVLVGILDTGVDGTHPALAERWQGNFAPASEAWLDAAQLGDTSFPVDRRGHGTHIMGTLTGLAPGDTIGVAPGARWIASNVIALSAGDDFDNAVLASLEFMADPDGNPATSDDVPAVVQNSWGVNESVDGYVDCDSRWWDAIDAVEAAGVILVWAAGNEGSNPGTVRSPADRASSPTNCFSVGSTFVDPPFTVNGFSSRGPSGCGGEYAVKPELVAPGASIYSAAPGGGYNLQSGTSMAGPHVAGIVALMRAANPTADGISIKEALLATAIDLGEPGPDNDSGHGFVDAHAAVLAVMAGVGTVAGRIVDAATGEPVVGARVERDSGFYGATTDADGRYRITLPEGPATFAVTAFGYAPGEVAVVVVDGVEVAGDAALANLPTAMISGHVFGPAAEVIPGAEITAVGTPLAPVLADVGGAYAIELPVDSGAPITLRARADGYGSQAQSLIVEGPVTRDFVLPATSEEGFESGDFVAFPWLHGGDAPWTIAMDDVFDGSFSARSGVIADQGQTELLLVYDVLQEGDLVFHARIDSEPGYDQFRFYLDGVLQHAWSGDVAWSARTVPLTVGRHTLRWVYAKDAYGSTGADAAWLDLITFPPAEVGAVPVMTVAPEFLDLGQSVLLPGSVPLTVSNGGDAALDFTVSVVEAATDVANPVPHLALAKGMIDPRGGIPPTTGGGGPDAFGHIWTDEEDPAGPFYEWIDISGEPPLDAGDDENLGPFPLGFTFPWFGSDRTELRVCSNGFVSFTSASADHRNQGMPDPAAPNDLLAPFWTDLDPGLGGTVHTRADPDRFIVQYEQVAHFSDPGTTETFQIILSVDGSVVFQYADVGDDAGCTVGIEGPQGEDGLLVQFNEGGYLRPGRAIRFVATAPPAWLQVAPATGVVPAGGQVQIDVTHATELLPGAYHAFLHVAGNDPARPFVTVPVTLTVDDLAGEGVPTMLSFAGAVPNPFNPMTQLRFALPREGQVGLRIHDVAGRLVRTLVDGRRAAGPHLAVWHGRDQGGRAVASGTYYARLVVDGKAITRAMTLIR